MKYKWVETTYHLLQTYDALALDHRKKGEPHEASSPEVTSGLLATRCSMDYSNYSHTFALININAAIVEGTMRSLLSEMVSKDVKTRTTQGIEVGQTERTPQENLLNKFYIELDSSGGWDKLKENYATYIGLSIDKTMNQNTKEAMQTLFLLRNIFAHGTTFIHPSQKVPDEMRDEPIFKWQSRVQSATAYLKKTFGHEDVFDNLAEYWLPKHFFDKTKDFFNEVLPAVNYSSTRIKQTVDIIKRASWGYRNFL